MTADDPKWVRDLIESMLNVLVIERGGEITFTKERLLKAVQTGERWYPGGIHAHYQKDEKTGDAKIKLVDAQNCRWEHDEVPTYASQYEEGSFVMKADGQVKALDELDEEDLMRINHAQHILLCAALDLIGHPIEVTKEQYDRVTAIGGMAGRGALSISKDGEKWTAALLSTPEIGHA